MKNIILFLFLGVIFTSVLIFLTIKNLNLTPPAPDASRIRIGLSLDSLKELRWQKDRDLMVQKAKELNATITSFVADSNDTTQISQIQNLISQKVDVIIIVAHNAKALGKVIDEAHQKGIKVIAYDRLILNSNIDLYVSFDSAKVGEYSAQYVLNSIPTSVTQPKIAFIGGSSLDNNANLIKEGAMKVLKPLIDSKKIKLVYQEFTPNWSPDIAYQDLQKFLQSGNKVDGVIASNDGTAFGAIQALTKYRLNGKVPVSGQDAELPAIKRLLDGSQTITLYKPLQAVSFKTVESAIYLAKNEKPDTNNFVNNGKLAVPAYLVDPIPVTKENIDTTVIKDKFYTRQEIYE